MSGRRGRSRRRRSRRMQEEPVWCRRTRSWSRAMKKWSRRIRSRRKRSSKSWRSSTQHDVEE